MTDSNYCAICLLIDRSGSMASIQTATQDSINEYVGAQRQRPGRTTIQIIQFDALDTFGPREGADWYLVHCPSVDPALVPPFVLQPRGWTALYDAMVKTVDEFGGELAALPEAQRPGTVILAILTDGKENASDCTADDVAQRVTRQRDEYGWEIVYLGANQDAILEAGRMGIAAASSMTYAATDRGTRSTVESLGAYTASAAGGQRAAFTDDDRSRAMGK